MSGPHWKLDDEGKCVTVTFPTDPPISLKLDATEVDVLLSNLGDFRALMQPEHHRISPVGQTVQAIPDPMWYTQPDAMAGNPLLHIRDPRYGWLHYMIPRDEARKLAGFLQTQADAPPLEPPPGRVN